MADGHVEREITQIIRGPQAAETLALAGQFDLETLKDLLAETIAALNTGLLLLAREIDALGDQVDAES